MARFDNRGSFTQQPVGSWLTTYCLVVVEVRVEVLDGLVRMRHQQWLHVAGRV